MVKASVRRLLCARCNFNPCYHYPVAQWYAHRWVNGERRARVYNRWSDAIAWATSGEAYGEKDLWRQKLGEHNGR
jgi:hypothetical protein